VCLFGEREREKVRGRESEKEKERLIVKMEEVRETSVRPKYRSCNVGGWKS